MADRLKDEEGDRLFPGMFRPESGYTQQEIALQSQVRLLLRRAFPSALGMVSFGKDWKDAIAELHRDLGKQAEEIVSGWTAKDMRDAEAWGIRQGWPAFGPRVLAQYGREVARRQAVPGKQKRESPKAKTSSVGPRAIQIEAHWKTLTDEQQNDYRQQQQGKWQGDGAAEAQARICAWKDSQQQAKRIRDDLMRRKEP